MGVGGGNEKRSEVREWRWRAGEERRRTDAWKMPGWGKKDRNRGGKSAQDRRKKFDKAKLNWKKKKKRRRRTKIWFRQWATVAEKGRGGQSKIDWEEDKEGEGQRYISQGVQSVYCLLCNTTLLIYSAEWLMRGRKRRDTEMRGWGRREVSLQAFRPN